MVPKMSLILQLNRKEQRRLSHYPSVTHAVPQRYVAGDALCLPMVGACSTERGEGLDVCWKMQTKDQLRPNYLLLPTTSTAAPTAAAARALMWQTPLSLLCLLCAWRASLCLLPSFCSDKCALYNSNLAILAGSKCCKLEHAD